MVKRLFDILFSLLGLIALAPLFLIIALLIKMEDKGPIFYSGIRAGRLNIPFRMFKFRTMMIDADKGGTSSTSNDDPRITKVGRFIRKYKLDEIPQLINVLKGEMSFVGPRPEVPAEVETYTEEEKKTLLVHPGITDWASIEFHNEGEILKGSLDPHQTYREKIRPEKIQLQLKYVKNHSFSVDLKILWQTFLTLFFTRVWKK